MSLRPLPGSLPPTSTRSRCQHPFKLQRKLEDMQCHHNPFSGWTSGDGDGASHRSAPVCRARCILRGAVPPGTAGTPPMPARQGLGQRWSVCHPAPRPGWLLPRRTMAIPRPPRGVLGGGRQRGGSQPHGQGTHATPTTVGASCTLLVPGVPRTPTRLRWLAPSRACQLPGAAATCQGLRGCGGVPLGDVRVRSPDRLGL
jgi:hypothetical protein